MSDTDKQGPAFIASVTDTYTDGKGQEQNYWTDVGVAFPHKDGAGFNVVIRKNLSVSGTIVLRVPRSVDKEKPQEDGSFPASSSGG